MERFYPLISEFRGHFNRGFNLAQYFVDGGSANVVLGIMLCIRFVRWGGLFFTGGFMFVVCVFR